MSLLFNRMATLKVSPATGGKGKSFAGLRVAFEIEKSSESTPNPAKIMIYNLSKPSRAELEKPGLIMILQVGYEGGPDDDAQLSQLYIGDVKRVTTKRQGPDLITTLEGGDSEKAIKEVKIDQSYKEFTSVAQVISSLASKLGVSIGTISASVTDVFQHGLSLTGLVSDNLDLLTKKLGLEWHITDGQLNILGPKESTLEPAILLSPATGLIGTPSKRQDDQKVKNAFTGIECSSLLHPGIKPGRIISLVSDQIIGVFRVRRGKFQGDTDVGEWKVDIEAVQ